MTETAQEVQEEAKETTRKEIDRKQLDQEGDVAADYLEGLLDICDLDGDIDIEVDASRARVSIVEVEKGDLKHLIGDDGEVLQALQELSRLAASRETGERSRLMLDIAGYRTKQKEVLEEAAKTACAEATRTAAPVRMAPMNPYERKVVHDLVATLGLVSESEGDEPARRVVIRVS
ncbi:MAG: R3H domain-containing nucleic acid-binding protein [Candidatus Nanopelagicales bacterium]|jgi:spoIIIJ-associated protein